MAAVVEQTDIVPGLMTAAEVVEQLQAEGHGTWEPGTLREWLRASPPVPCARRGKPGRDHLYSYAAVVAWLEARELARLEDPRITKAREEARLARLKADEMEGHLLRSDEVEAGWALVVDANRAAWLGLPARLSAALESCVDAASRRAAIEAEVHHQLSRLSRGLPQDDEGDEQ